MPDFFSTQDVSENCHHPDLVRKLLRLELSFAFALEHVIDLIVLGERMSTIAFNKIGVVRKKKQNRKYCSLAGIQ